MNDHKKFKSVAIIGAGPYGLSLAAHLREAGIDYRIFGKPMQSWETQTPQGMKLKSEGHGANLFSGSIPYTFEKFCSETGRAYHPTQMLVGADDFALYGQEFARRFVTDLDESKVCRVAKVDGGYELTTERGEHVLARAVVIATGVSLFEHIPAELSHLPKDMVTHSLNHHTFHEFAGREITFLGRGASTLNAAVLAHDHGARVTLLSRKKSVVIAQPSPMQRSLRHRLRHPRTPLSYGLRSWVACAIPGLLHALPDRVRSRMFRGHLGPAGGTALQGRASGEFPMLLGWSIERAEFVASDQAADRRIVLTLVDGEGNRAEHTTEHLVAGTGFRVDTARYYFLPDEVKSAIRTKSSGGPQLSSHFETSVDGLYLIGPVATEEFGPMLRFAAGAGFAARKVTLHLAKHHRRAQ